MSMAWRVAVGLLIAAIIGLAVYYALTSNAQPSPEELLARVESSHPTWQSYYEDIKDQIGAGPVAQWQGRLTEVRIAGGEVEVKFSLAGPWADRHVAIPVLLRDARGEMMRESRVRFEGDSVTYTFPTDASKPWIELQSPEGTRRVALPESGVWANPETE